LLLATVLLAWLAWPTGQPALAEQPTYTPLDVVTAGRMDTLRRDTGLDDDVLECLNLNDTQLETLLPAVRSWYETHAAAWRAAQTAVADQQARIRQLESALANGHDETAALAAARQQLVSLEAAYETQLASLRNPLVAALSESQQALLTRMRTRATAPLPFRILDLSTEQDQTVTRLTTDYHQRLALAREAQTRAALAAAYAQNLDATLGPTNVQLLAALNQYLGPASQYVVAALQRVFPRLPEG
jgi:DNA repair exonuclease SbcCD ATPase subunit